MAEGPDPGVIRATALIVAAGSGQRLGAGGPKALVPVGGRPMYEWSVLALQAASRIGRIVVAVPPGRAASFDFAGIATVDGGAARSQSVAAGLELVDTEIVLVHDAARPLVTPELIDGAVDALIADPGTDATIAAAPVTDTIKRVDASGSVEATVDRDTLAAVQTPQVFRTESLRRAIAEGDPETATDDAFLIESAGGIVKIHPSTGANIKVTVPADLALAELLLEQSSNSMGTPSI